MRIAVSGAHSTGKTTLISAFLAKRPHYGHEPEAFETIGDEIGLTSGEGPSPEGLQSLLEYTATALRSHAGGACVIVERSPVDYVGYAAASRGTWPKGAIREFIGAQAPLVRDCLRYLDLIVLLPVSTRGPVRARPDEDVRFRKRVDECLRRALVDDEYELFVDLNVPAVVELSPLPELQLLELVRLTSAEALK